VYAIDLDGGAFGQQMLQGINASIINPAHSLGWHFGNAVKSDADSKHLVLNEQAWAVVQSKPSKVTTCHLYTNPRSKSKSHFQPTACPSYRKHIVQLPFRHDYLHRIGTEPDNNQFKGDASHPRRRESASCEAWGRIDRHISHISRWRRDRSADSSPMQRVSLVAVCGARGRPPPI
jgi:hypothetical protein